MRDQSEEETVCDLLFAAAGQWWLWRGIFLTDSADEKEKRKRLLRQCAPSIEHIRVALFRTIVLDVCRLLDPAKDRAGNKNLSFERLVQSLPVGESRATFEKELAEIREQSRPLRRLRDKTISHNDLRHLLKGEPIEGITTKFMIEFQDRFFDFGNRLNVARFGPSLALNEQVYSLLPSSFLGGLRRSHHLACLVEAAIYEDSNLDLADVLKWYRARGLPEQLSELMIERRQKHDKS